MKKIMLYLLLSCINQNIFAITCPTTEELRAGQLNGWRPVTLDDAEPVSDKALLDYRKKVQTFAFAGWLPDAPEGAAECFYNGVETDDSYLGIFLVKSDVNADIHSLFWSKSSSYQWLCTREIKECNFI